MHFHKLFSFRSSFCKFLKHVNVLQFVDDSVIARVWPAKEAVSAIFLSISSSCGLSACDANDVQTSITALSHLGKITNKRQKIN